MNSELICLPLAFLFLANVGSIIGQKGAADAELRVRAGQPLRLECALGDAAAAQWRRDGAPVPADLRAAPERAAGPRLLAALAAPAARAAHAGLYTCSARADYRVRLTVLPAEAETEATPEAAGNIVWYDVRGNLTLRCDLPADKTLPYVWKKNGTDVSEVPLLKGRHALDAGGAELAVRGRSVEDDFGPYECAVGARAQAFDVRGRPHPRLPANSQVVEGQKLKLTCKLTGKPYVSVTWTYNSSVDAPAGDDVLASLAGRAQLQANEQGVEGAELVIAAVERTDAGLYWCHAGSARSSTRLHVKDMYAALWPFLGICAEVVVLCAVILLYERRRAKPELDDSDTDNHDQKKS